MKLKLHSSVKKIIRTTKLIPFDPDVNLMGFFPSLYTYIKLFIPLVSTMHLSELLPPKLACLPPVLTKVSDPPCSLKCFPPDSWPLIFHRHYPLAIVTGSLWVVSGWPKQIQPRHLLSTMCALFQSSSSLLSAVHFHIARVGGKEDKVRLLPRSLDLGCQIDELSEKAGCFDSEGILSPENNGRPGSYRKPFLDVPSFTKW